MTTWRKHAERAVHNEGLLQPLVRLDTHPDWYITAAFYAGVHWLRAFLALHGVGVGEREDVHYDDFARHLRDISRRKNLDVELVVQNFKDMKDLARAARYHCLPKHWYDQKLHEVDAALKAVREFVTANGVVP